MLNEGKHLTTQRRENAFIKVTRGVGFGKVALGTTENVPQPRACWPASPHGQQIPEKPEIGKVCST